MIHALHGNAGLPEDLEPVLTGIGRPSHGWDLWRCLETMPQCASLTGFASMLNDAVRDDIRRPRVLLGYSLGARLALHALAQCPDKWDAAVLISAHPGLQTEEERASRREHDMVWHHRFLNEPWDRVLADWNGQTVLTGAIPPHPIREIPQRQVVRAFDVWSLGRQEDLRPRLPSLTCPVLWLTGVRDEKFTALAAEACPLLPHGIHAAVPEAGHRVHLDQPAAVIQKTREFLDSAGL